MNKINIIVQIFINDFIKNKKWIDQEDSLNNTERVPAEDLYLNPQKKNSMGGRYKFTHKEMREESLEPSRELMTDMERRPLKSPGPGS